MAAHRQQPRLYVALDFPDSHQAQVLVEQLDPSDCGLKVGKELFTRSGPEYVRTLIDQGFAVFLDLKFHDIPHTVEQACRAACDLGVSLVNVHASGGRAMLAAARRAIPAGDDAPALIAVTVLTSLSATDLTDIGVHRSLADQVHCLAQLACEAGLDGVVCSAWEAAALRTVFTQPDPVIVTPGIRPTGTELDDQVRIMTPVEAITAGATSIVVGRPITRAVNPAVVARDIAQSIRSI